MANDVNKLKESHRFKSEQSVVYHADKIQKKCFIFMDSKTILNKNGYLFVGEGGIIKV